MPSRVFVHFSVVASIVLLFLFLTFWQRVPINRRYDFFKNGTGPDDSSDGPLGDDLAADTPPENLPPSSKIIVIGQLQGEDTSWVAEYFPDWQNALYVVDNTTADLHTGMNKGREANAYLTYIIDNYHKLPGIIAFVHSHRDGWPGSWHTDAPNYDNVNSLTALKLEFVQRNGYANLRCLWAPGCPDEVQPFRESDPMDEDRAHERAFADAWTDLFSSEVPSVTAATCCAQFVVSRDQVLRRPLQDYKHYHKWLMETPLDDKASGTIFEYLWHIIFGQDPVYCPAPAQCYQDVYGRH